MQQAVNGVVRVASADCEAMPLEEFTHKYHAQISLIGIQFIWTLDCEDSLYRAKAEKGVMNQTAKKNLQRLNELVSINLKSDTELAAFGAPQQQIAAAAANPGPDPVADSCLR